MLAQLPSCRSYLGRFGIQELDVYGLNRVLQRHGLAIGHNLPSQEYPELVVKIRTDEIKWEAATRFWLEPYSPPKEPVGPDGIPLKYLVR